MLTIRASQLKALERQGKLRFVRQYRDLVRERVGKAAYALSDEALETEMLRLLDRAHGLNLETDLVVVSFMVVAVRKARCFYLHPPFHKLLTDTTVPESERIPRVLKESTARDWRAAKELVDEPSTPQ